MTVIPFSPYLRPCAVLHSPGKLRSGERFYILDLLPSERDGGGHSGIWDGTDYDLAVEAALDLEADGLRVYYVDGEARL